MNLTFTTPIVGGKFRPPALLIMGALGQGQALIAVREPANEYDANAISIRISGDDVQKLDEETVDAVRRIWAENTGEDPGDFPAFFHLGYVPRETAKVWAETMDKELTRKANEEDTFSDNLSFPAVLTFNMQGFPEVTVTV